MDTTGANARLRTRAEMLALLLAEALYEDIVTVEGGMHVPPRDGAQVGWDEAERLNVLIWGWYATLDPIWLERFVARFDHLTAGSERRADGQSPSWKTRRYSNARVTTHVRGANGRLRPADRRQLVPYRYGGDTLARTTVDIEFIDSNSYRVLPLVGETTTAPPQAFANGVAIDPSSGRSYPSAAHARQAGLPAPVVIDGEPIGGERITFEVRPARALEHLVLDGQVWYAVALFVEQVRSHPNAVPPRLSQRADHYEKVFVHVFDHWMDQWNPSLGAGWFEGHSDPSHPWNRRPLPLNQALSFGRATAVWARCAKSTANRKRFARLTEALARTFRQHMIKMPDGRMIWPYLAFPSEPGNIASEDVGHASIDIDFIEEAIASDLGFTPGDRSALLATYAGAMRDESASPPLMTERIDGTGGITPAWKGWIWLDDSSIGLGADPNPDAHPHMTICRLAVLARRGKRDRRVALLFNEFSHRLERQLRRRGGRDGSGFEVGRKEPFLWASDVWSGGSGTGLVTWSKAAHHGRRALALQPTEGRPNLVASRTYPTPPGTAALEVRFSYRSSEHSIPWLSATAFDESGSELKTTMSPILRFSPEWRTTRWWICLGDAMSIKLRLRNTGSSPVWFDDVQVAAHQSPPSECRTTRPLQGSLPEH